MFYNFEIFFTQKFKAEHHILKHISQKSTTDIVWVDKLVGRHNSVWDARCDPGHHQDPDSTLGEVQAVEGPQVSKEKDNAVTSSKARKRHLVARRRFLPSVSTGAIDFSELEVIHIKCYHFDNYWRGFFFWEALRFSIYLFIQEYCVDVAIGFLLWNTELLTVSQFKSLTYFPL